MEDDIQISYYSIIPATVRYDTKLKPAEKLMYGEITSLANVKGFCYANNQYFANLYNVTTHTVSQWISHLEKLGYIKVEIIRDNKNAVIARNIYIVDTPYVQKNTYPSIYKSTYPMYKNVQYNNTRYNKDDLFILIINKSEKLESDFFKLVEKLEFNYNQKMIETMQEDKIEMIKDIVYVLYEVYKMDLGSLLTKISRESLLNLYLASKEHNPKNLLTYYKKAIINKYRS